MKALLLTLCITLCSCQSEKSSALTFNGVFFDTVIQVTIYDNQNQALIDEIEKLCQKYDTLFSRTNPNSEISKVNQAKGKPVVLSDETADIIKTSLIYSEYTDGLFDISIAPVTDLWDFKAEKSMIPNQSSIDEALSHVDYKKIHLNGNILTLTDPDMKLDLGGIAKGYIADCIAQYLKDKGVESALINLGGNVLAIGEKPEKTDFVIGIQKPFDEAGVPITSIKLKNASSVTSGIYERYFEKNGQIYHHILDTKTGYPCKNNLQSVTIISRSSTNADALSTSCFLLGLDKGMQLINATKDTEAIFITDDNKLHYSQKL